MEHSTLDESLSNLFTLLVKRECGGWYPRSRDTQSLEHDFYLLLRAFLFLSI